jgi:hypothetical protein
MTRAQITHSVSVMALRKILFVLYTGIQWEFYPKSSDSVPAT